MNKRGYIQDFAFFGIILMIFALVVISSGTLMSSLNTEINDSNLGDNAKTISNNAASRFSSIFDWAFLIVFMFFGMAIMVSMFMLDTHPVLFFVVLIVFAFILIAIGIMGNVYEEFTDGSGPMAEQAAEMEVLDYVMDNYVLGVLVLGFLGIIVLFAKLRVFGA